MDSNIRPALDAARDHQDDDPEVLLMPPKCSFTVKVRYEIRGKADPMAYPDRQEDTNANNL